MNHIDTIYIYIYIYIYNSSTSRHKLTQLESTNYQMGGHWAGLIQAGKIWREDLDNRLAKCRPSPALEI